jgi:ABC-type phosphate transport system auxiliary subunit
MKAELEFAFLNGRAADAQLSLNYQAAMKQSQAEFHEDMRRVEDKLDALTDELQKAKVRLPTLMNG